MLKTVRHWPLLIEKRRRTLTPQQPDGQGVRRKQWGATGFVTVPPFHPHVTGTNR